MYTVHGTAIELIDLAKEYEFFNQFVHMRIKLILVEALLSDSHEDIVKELRLLDDLFEKFRAKTRLQVIEIAERMGE